MISKGNTSYFPDFEKYLVEGLQEIEDELDETLEEMFAESSQRFNEDVDRLVLREMFVHLEKMVIKNEEPDARVLVGLLNAPAHLTEARRRTLLMYVEALLLMYGEAE